MLLLLLVVLLRLRRGLHCIHLCLHHAWLNWLHHGRLLCWLCLLLLLRGRKYLSLLLILSLQPIGKLLATAM